MAPRHPRDMTDSELEAWVDQFGYDAMESLWASDTDTEIEEKRFDLETGEISLTPGQTENERRHQQMLDEDNDELWARSDH